MFKYIRKINYGLKKEFSLFPIVLFILSLLLAVITLSKITFLVLLFIGLDYLKSLIEVGLPFNYLPLKFISVGMITLSYFYSFKIGLVLVGFYVINKLMFARFDERHFLATISMIVMCLLSNLFNSINYAILGTTLFIFRYVLDFIFNILFFSYVRTDNLLGRAINSVVAYLIFSLISFFI